MKGAAPKKRTGSSLRRSKTSSSIGTGRRPSGARSKAGGGNGRATSTRRPSKGSNKKSLDRPSAGLARSSSASAVGSPPTAQKPHGKHRKTQNVRVVCRVRPPNTMERQFNARVFASTQVPLDGLLDRDDSGTCVSISKPPLPKEYNNQIPKDLVDGKPLQFTFDAILPEHSSQSQVFDATAGPLVEEIMQGYNATVFAYGQTGSGKTHTMMGYSQAEIQEAGTVEESSEDEDEDDDPLSDAEIEAAVANMKGVKWDREEDMGIIPRLVKAVFLAIGDAPPGIEFTVAVQFVEIYLEKIRDLLNPKNQNLKIRENKVSGVFIEDVVSLYVGSYEEVLQIMQRGEKNRSVGRTNMNKKSSRSHSVFIMEVKQRNVGSAAKKTSKLTLVDLAGSEKVRKTGASGLTLLQARHTNKSLAALGNVINSLTTKQPHVPYRDSKLTRLLTDSLGGNSKTCLIVTCSPSMYNLEETISTLRFGIRAKNIKNKPKINREKTVEEYKQMIATLRGQLKEQSIIIQTLEADVLTLSTATKKHGVDLSKLQLLSKLAGGSGKLLTPAVTAPATRDMAASPASTTSAESKAPTSVDAPPSPTFPSASGMGRVVGALEWSDDELGAGSSDEDFGGWLSSELYGDQLRDKMVRDLQAKVKELKAAVAESEELQEELRDQLLQKDSLVDDAEQQVYRYKHLAHDTANRLKEVEEQLKQTQNQVLSTEVAERKAQIAEQEHQLQLRQLKGENEQLQEEQKSLLSRVQSLEQTVHTFEEQEAERKKKAELSVSAQQLDHLRASYDRLLKDFRNKCEEVSKLEMEKEDLEWEMGRSGGNKGSAASGSAVSADNGPKPASSKEHQALLEDFQHKCEQNVRLQLEMAELESNLQQTKEQLTQMTNDMKELEKRPATKTAADPNAMAPEDVWKFVAQMMAVANGVDHTHTTEQCDATQPSELLPRPSGSLSRKHVSDAFARLRQTVLQLQHDKEQSQRQTSYTEQLMESKQEHIEVLEQALHQSNELHRKTLRAHSTKMKEYEAEIRRLKHSEHGGKDRSGGRRRRHKHRPKEQKSKSPSGIPAPSSGSRHPKSIRSGRNHAGASGNGHIVKPIRGGGGKKAHQRTNSGWFSWWGGDHTGGGGSSNN